jgi:hypothetical protein
MLKHLLLSMFLLDCTHLSGTIAILFDTSGVGRGILVNMFKI